MSTPDTNKTPAPVPAAAPVAATSEDIKNLVTGIGQLIPKKRTMFHELKPKSSFNPEGKKSRKLIRTFYQNGNRVNVKTLFDEEIKLLNGLKPGKYMDGLVTVKVIEQAGDTPDIIRIDYPNKTHDQRIQVATRIRSMVHLLRTCTEEAALAAQGKRRGDDDDE